MYVMCRLQGFCFFLKRGYKRLSPFPASRASALLCALKVSSSVPTSMAYLIFLSLLRLHALFNPFSRIEEPSSYFQKIDAPSNESFISHFWSWKVYISFRKVVCRELGLGFAQSGAQTNYFNSNSTTEEIISGKLEKWIVKSFVDYVLAMFRCILPRSRNVFEWVPSRCHQLLPWFW